jgi:uncharacterized protein YcfJ
MNLFHTRQESKNLGLSKRAHATDEAGNRIIRVHSRPFAVQTPQPAHSLAPKRGGFAPSSSTLQPQELAQRRLYRFVLAADNATVTSANKEPLKSSKLKKLKVMKTLAAIILAGAALTQIASGQLLNQESLTGAALGGIAGAVIGNQHHGQSGEGAAIGAGVGYLLGQAVHNQRQQAYGYPPPQYAGGYAVSDGAYYYGDPYPYPASAPNYYYGAQYQPRPRINRAIGGAVLGGVAGAVIGNQHHGQSGEGAAIGAAAGLVLGGIAEHQARKRERAQAENAYYWQSRQRALAQAQANAQAHAQAQADAQAQRAAPAQPLIKPPANQSNLKDANALFGR